MYGCEAWTTTKPILKQVGNEVLVLKKNVEVNMDSKKSARELSPKRKRLNWPTLNYSTDFHSVNAVH